MPNLQRLGAVNVGETVEEQLAVDRTLEEEAIARYRRGVALCLGKGDPGTREMLEQLTLTEEEHLDWIETQQGIITDIGIERYQQSMMGDLDA